MTPKLFDIHAHVNFADFNQDRTAVIKRALDAGVGIINVGSNLEDSKRAIEIAHQYPEGVYATVGIHPTENLETEFPSEMKDLAKDQKVVAIGECGIDMFRQEKSDLARQENLFRQHVELAIEVNKPSMIHCREAHDEVLKILEEYRGRVRGNVHFFSGDWTTAQKYFDLGFTISFTGVITFTHDYDEVIKNSPLEKIMVETDAPFVAPIPHRGQRNEPAYVMEVVKVIAEIKGLSYEEVCRTTTQNAKNLFSV